MPLVSPPWRALGGALLVALLAACGKAPPPEEPVRAVKLVTVGETAYEAGHEYAAEVRAREQFYLQRGINSVPAVIINDKHLISGGQPVEVFEQALRQLAAEAA